MNKKPQGLTATSDWIIFLQGEVTTTISFMFPFYTALIIIYIALIQINQNVGSELLPTGFNDIVLALLFLLFVPAIIVIWDIRPINKLCKQIVMGELTTHEEILKEYEKIEKRYKFSIQKIPKKISNNKAQSKKNNVHTVVENESNTCSKSNWEKDPHFVRYKKK
jgi:hypothetical protein